LNKKSIWLRRSTYHLERTSETWKDSSIFEWNKKLL